MINKPDFNKPIQVSTEGIHSANISFDWGQSTIGFGQLGITKLEDGRVVCNSEGMVKEWVRRALYAAVDALVDTAEIED